MRYGSLGRQYHLPRGYDHRGLRLHAGDGGQRDRGPHTGRGPPGAGSAVLLHDYLRRDPAGGCADCGERLAHRAHCPAGGGQRRADPGLRGIWADPSAGKRSVHAPGLLSKLFCGGGAAPAGAGVLYRGGCDQYGAGLCAHRGVPSGDRRGGHRYRAGVCCGRHHSAVLFCHGGAFRPAADQEPALSQAAASGVQQRLIRTDEQHLLLGDQHFV